MRKNQGESTASIVTDQKNAKGGKLADNTNLN